MKSLSQNFSNSSEKVLIAEGLQLTGDMVLGKSGIMNGKIRGNIQADGKIVIGEKGSVDGEIICGECEVEGKVKGNIQTQGFVRITGKVKGNVYGSGLEITPDANVEGYFQIGSTPTQWNSIWKQVKTISYKLMRRK